MNKFRNKMFCLNLFVVIVLLLFISSCFLRRAPGRHSLTDVEGGGEDTPITDQKIISSLIFNPVEGLVPFGSQVSINDVEQVQDSVIYYTVDNGDPVTTGSLYTGAIRITRDTVIKAIAVKEGAVNSEIAVASYTVLKATKPIIDTLSGTVLLGTDVSISSTLIDSSIYYTTDGSDPTSSSILYTGPININQSMTLNAVVVKSGYIDSDIATAVYTIPDSVQAPEFSEASGNLLMGTSVSITTSSAGASIYYTIDGSAPNQSSTLYTSPIVIDESTTIKAIAYKSGYPHSAVSTVTYIIPSVVEPVFDIEPGAVDAGTELNISTVTDDADIYYTNDGTDPSCNINELGTSSQYLEPINLDTPGSFTYKAIACKLGYIDSPIATSSYVVSLLGVTSSPVILPSTGTVSPTPITVTMIAESGSTIHYTSDGTSPNCGNGTVYSGSITVSSSTVFKAIACKANWENSAVITASYTITGTLEAPVISPVTGSVSPVAIAVTMMSGNGSTIHYTADGSEPTCSSSVYSSSIVLDSTGTYIYKAIACKSDWITSSVTTSSYTITGVVNAPVFSLAEGLYVTSQTLTISTSTYGATIRYTNDGSTPTCSTGSIYSSAITVNSPGATYKAIACKTNWIDSAVVSSVYTVTGTLADPSFSPLAGLYTSAQNITITTIDPGATVYYTLDGTDPVCGSGFVYAGPVELSLPDLYVVKAISCKTNWQTSGISTSMYSITGTVSSPTFSPEPGSYNAGQVVTMSSSTSGATIRYTTNGTDPTCSVGTIYMSPITIISSTIFKAIACKTDWSPSELSTVQYTIVFEPITTSHFAGSIGGAGSDDGIGSAASFNNPNGLVINGTDLYVVDTAGHTIRKIELSTGTVTTLAGLSAATGSTNGVGSSARFNSPQGLVSDGTNLYVADSGNSQIRKIVIATGEVTTFAGSTIGSTDGIGTAAKFYTPYGITSDGTNLYVADYNGYTVRKIVISTAAVTTLAGTYGASGTTDGIGAAARFNQPNSLTYDGNNLYVTESGNHIIRKVVPSTGEVITFAGLAGTTGSTNGTGTAARFNQPYGITTDGINLYVADTQNTVIRKIVISTGVVSTFAGSVGVAGFVNASTGTSSKFIYPRGVVTDGTNLYIADTYGYNIRKLVLSTTAVTAIAGAPNETGTTNGFGSAARFSGPIGITDDGTNLYVVDGQNNRIRKIVIATGEVTTFAGSSSGSTDGVGTAAKFNSPYGITNDGVNLYVADGNHTIRKIVIATADVTTFAGAYGVSGTTDGIGTAARFNYVTSITNDGTNLYVTDRGNNTIRKIVIDTAEVTTLAGLPGTSGSADGIGTAARFYWPFGITTDGTNLYVSDNANHTIRKIVISTGLVSTIAGTVGSTGSNDGAGLSAKFNYPFGLATDGNNLYVADRSNNTIRKIVLSSGIVSTMAGYPLRKGRGNGSLATATFSQPMSLDYVAGKLFVVEGSSGGNNDIRKIE